MLSVQLKRINVYEVTSVPIADTLRRHDISLQTTFV